MLGYSVGAEKVVHCLGSLLVHLIQDVRVAPVRIAGSEYPSILESGCDRLPTRAEEALLVSWVNRGDRTMHRELLSFALRVAGRSRQRGERIA